MQDNIDRDISLSLSLSLSLDVEIIVTREQYVVLREEMARRVRFEHSIRCVAFWRSMHIPTYCRYSWRERVLHFAIVAIQRTTRKTSLKGHTRRVIRLYVTRPPSSHPAQCYGNVWNFRQREFRMCTGGV